MILTNIKPQASQVNGNFSSEAVGFAVAQTYLSPGDVLGAVNPSAAVSFQTGTEEQPPHHYRVSEMTGRYPLTLLMPAKILAWKDL